MVGELAGKVQTITKTLQRIENTLASDSNRKGSPFSHIAGRTNEAERNLLLKLSQADEAIARLKRHKNCLIKENQALRLQLGETSRSQSPFDMTRSITKSQTSTRLGRSSSFLGSTESTKQVEYWKNKALEMQEKIKAAELWKAKALETEEQLRLMVREYEQKEQFWTHRVKLLGEELDLLATENAKYSEQKTESTALSSIDAADIVRELKAYLKLSSDADILGKVSDLGQKLRHSQHLKHRLAALVNSESLSSKELYAILKRHIQVSLDLTKILGTQSVIEKVREMMGGTGEATAEH